MSTLLDSRESHHRVRLLSRKVRETEIDNEECPRRQQPCANTNRGCDELTMRQRGQRKRRQIEKDRRTDNLLKTVQDRASNICFPKNLSNVSVVDDALRESSTPYRRRQRQRQRRQQERMNSISTCTKQNERLRLGSTTSNTYICNAHYIYRSCLQTETATGTARKGRALTNTLYKWMSICRHLSYNEMLFVPSK